MSSMKKDNGLPEEKEEKKVGKRAVAKLLSLVALSAVLLGIYKLFIELFNFEYIFFIYLGAEIVLIVIYLFYNRGLSLKGVTKDMLPDTMSDSEKGELLSSAERRLKRSSFMLIPIIAIIFTLIFDTVELYILPMILGGNK